jgi:starch phosphorylase
VSRGKGDGVAANLGVGGDTLARDVLDNLRSRQGRYPQIASRHRELFRPLLEHLLHNDPFLVLADFADYAACQER